jgi:hypothetical protein
MLAAKAGAGMVRSFYVLSDTGIGEMREWAPSATTALRLARTLVKLRRPGVRIEDERGNSISLFQLKDMADFEMRKKNAPAVMKARNVGPI